MWMSERLKKLEHCSQQPDNYENDSDNKRYVDKSAQTFKEDKSQ